MATTELTTPAFAGGTLLRLAGTAASRAVALLRAWRNRHQVARLLALDARMLSDIGITPGDVRSAMAMPVSSDPSSHLADLAQERRTAQRARLGQIRRAERRSRP
ncbi:MAG: DUF1127 domain-containing protein [Bauldia sp.]|uniref:DUF1127 domain-containing protein n=1 Tax=Bauldia sp. TaxID=2575872 RepID=UPI001DA1418F|nr:DUF1127 domain-containing protein [Bauldia sp.]MCB1496911.1 DUF1127 domain-containing protein [Bauldia sp.]